MAWQVYQSMRSHCVIYHWGQSWGGGTGRQVNLMTALAQYADILYLDDDSDKRLSVNVVDVGGNIKLVRGLTRTVKALARRNMGAVARAYAWSQLNPVLRSYKRRVFWCSEAWNRIHRYIPHDALLYD